MRRNQLFGSASSSSSLPWGNQVAKAQVRHDPTVAAPQPSIVEARPLLAGRRTKEGMATPIPKSCPPFDSNFFSFQNLALVRKFLNFYGNKAHKCIFPSSWLEN
jgi:hypothetical protein